MSSMSTSSSKEVSSLLSKLPHIKLSQLTHELWCDWKDCNAVFHDLTLYLQHIHTHSYSNHHDLTSPLSCQWISCGDDTFESQAEFELHVSFHGFHQKLMSIGSLMMKEIGRKLNTHELSCCMDSSSRNVLPRLPEHFICYWNECLTEFNDAESFYRHVDTHATVDVEIPSLSKEVLKRTKFATCRWLECVSGFSSRSHLKEHLRSHTQEKLMACPGCGAMFSNRAKFVDHLFRQSSILDKRQQDNNMSNEVTLQLSKRVGDNEETVTTFTIQMPTNQDGTQQGQSIILQNLNGEDEVMLIDLNADLIARESQKAISSAINLFQCSYCDSSFATSSLLEEHTRKHVHKHECHICGMTTNSASTLRQHISYRHESHRPFACQFCECKFKSRSDLRRHIDTHNEEASYLCTLCDLQFRSSHSLTKHIKEEHENIKSEYVCHLCERKFNRGNNLTRHLIGIHKLTLPSGQSRFMYQKQDNGHFRLVSKSVVVRS